MTARRLALVAGVAIASTVLPAQGAHAAFIKGTTDGDVLHGTDGRDVIRGKAGNDRIFPGASRDVVYAGAGNDYIFLTNDFRVDKIFCGPGFDVVVWSFDVDHRDIIASDCEARIA